jgi:hypothetical protein
MVAAVLEDGAAGKRWQESSTTGDELIWSVQPKQSAEERKRLASLASSLVRRIGAGLDAIGVPAAERSPFLNALFDLQTAALRSQAPTPPSPGTAADSPRAVVVGASPAAPRVLERDGWRVHYLGMPSDTRSPHTLTVANWQVGDWLRFRMANTEPLCGLGCWQNPSSGTILFFNPDWPYAVAMSAATVDQQIRSGRAQLVSRVPIFDAAAERALGLLEKTLTTRREYAQNLARACLPRSIKGLGTNASPLRPASAAVKQAGKAARSMYNHAPYEIDF